MWKYSGKLEVGNITCGDAFRLTLKIDGVKKSRALLIQSLPESATESVRMKAVRSVIS